MRTMMFGLCHNSDVAAAAAIGTGLADHAAQPATEASEIKPMSKTLAAAPSREEVRRVEAVNGINGFGLNCFVR